MTQQALMIGVALFAGLAAAGLVWAAPDVLALIADRLDAWRRRRRLKADAAALLDQAADRPKRKNA